MSSCFSFSRSSRRCLRSLRCSCQRPSTSGVASVVGCPGDACTAPSDSTALLHAAGFWPAGAERGPCSQPVLHGKCSDARPMELANLGRGRVTFLVSISGIATGGCSSAGGSMGTGCCTYQVMASVLNTGTCVIPACVNSALVDAQRRAMSGSTMWLEMPTTLPGRLCTADKELD